MPTAPAKRTTRGRGKPEKFGSSIAPKISRARSARKLKHSTPSPSLHAAIVADHGWQDELVELLLGVGVRDRGLRIGKARPIGLDHGVIRLLHALPALVAIHAVIAAHHGGDPHRRRQRRGEPLEVVAGGLRGRIAPVGERMNQRRHAGFA